MIRTVSILLTVFALVSCGTTKIVEKKVPIPYVVEVYPELPPVEDFDNRFPLDEVEFDIPRDMTAEPFLLSTPGCKGKIKENLSADDPCLVYPPDTSSNLYIGMDQENTNKLRLNLKKIGEKERLRDEQDAQIDRMREEWRKKNDVALKQLDK